MMQFTEEQRKALVGLCRIEIKRWKAASESNPNMRYMVELMEIALAALTAKPVAWRWEKNNGLYFEGIKPIGVESQPLYTTSPVSGWNKRRCDDVQEKAK